MNGCTSYPPHVDHCRKINMTTVVLLAQGVPMDQITGNHRVPALPIEIWTLVCDFMSTKDWARARGTCRSMAKVLPRRIMLEPTRRRHFEWLVKQWGEAEGLKLELDCSHLRISRTRLEGYLAEFRELQLESLEIKTLPLCSPCRPVYSSDEDTEQQKFDPEAPLDKYRYHSWVCSILQHAPKLALLRLMRVYISVISFTSNLKHLLLIVERRSHEFCADDCRSLQSLCSLETCELGHTDKCLTQKAADIDLMACPKLRALSLRLIEPAAVRVPEGCSVFMTGNQVEVNSNWPVVASMSTSCYFQEFIDTDYTDEAPDLTCQNGFLNSTPCDNLTFLQIDYEKFCSWDHPVVIGPCLAKLQHLTIVSGNVHVCFASAVALQTFVVVAKECMSLRVRDVDWFTVDTLAATLEQVHFRWKFCCPRTYSLLGLLHAPIEMDDFGLRWEASTPAFRHDALKCRCGACYECLGCKEMFCT